MFKESLEYQRAARLAVALEKKPHYQAAARQWRAAAQASIFLVNQHWAIARAEFCEHQYQLGKKHD